MTATPMINRTINLQGYRNMLWDPAWQTNEQFEDRLAAYQAVAVAIFSLPVR